MLIAFTGCDGCGKSTQLRRAEQWLKSRGVAVHVVDKWRLKDRSLVPECRFIGGSLEELKQCIAEMEGPARALFLFWTLTITAQRISEARAAGEICLADGYWMKVAAAELTYGCSPALIARCVEQLREPDLTLLFDAPPEETLRRKLAADLLTPYECGRDASLSPGGYLAHQKAVRAVLRTWAEEHGWRVIDASQPTEAVWDTVRGVLEHIMAGAVDGSPQRGSSR
jgi:dTMP kinase